ncbi:unnamed protein product [Dovyalis caffra]|uniref:Uncharacterized protein n=1 Tax=Dovyalis caffra TaxID=77055 RepID=A0AAV1QXH3_9ROSI|nr:unnamed protein product [Dovyalis caffra]
MTDPNMVIGAEVPLSKKSTAQVLTSNACFKGILTGELDRGPTLMSKDDRLSWVSKPEVNNIRRLTRTTTSRPLGARGLEIIRIRQSFGLPAVGFFGAATLLSFLFFLVSLLSSLSSFFIMSLLPVLSSNSQTQHDDQSHDDLESNLPDQSTQASNSDQTRRCRDIKRKDCPTSPNLMSNSPASSPASSESITRLRESTNTNSPSLPNSTLSLAHENPAQSQQGLPDHANPSHPLPFHPIIEMLRQQELGRHMLVLSVPMTIGLFVVYNSVKSPLALNVMALAIALGFVGIWNGILLRTSCREASNIIELLGIAFMLLAYFGFVACFLPEKFIWVPYLCWLLSVVVFVITLRL